MTLLALIAATSRTVTETSSRLEKTRALAACLRSVAPGEIPIAIAYLSGGKTLPSHNTLIGRFEGADGMKTGYTCPSGYNLIGSATRSGRTLMAVVVGSTSVDSRAEQAASNDAIATLGFPTQPLEQA